ncbi:MAG: hypothetical protein GYB53_21380 [Rhodobacteraceae bacterium]|nr:hypothetical protein [Paracoccaceae bacterium]MBR9823061.1 hypothetical protein [Paracoccaceae bacterium]
MADHPILFSPTMVCALLEGRKTQTRRVLKGLLPDDMPYVQEGEIQQSSPSMQFEDRRWPGTMSVGDHLWVRETFTLTQHDHPVYRADATDQSGKRWTSIAPGDPDGEVIWKPSIFMPRWASRLTLTVTDVRVQRLQEISEGDAKAEGIDDRDVVCGFSELWDSLNAKRGYGWDANPWVAAYSFHVEKINIDRMGAA